MTEPERRESWRTAATGARYLAVTILGLLASLTTACVYHGDDVCSPGQVPAKGSAATDFGQCVCAPNHVPVKRPILVVTPSPGDVPLVEKCTPCGDHSSAVGDSCVCDPGYVQGVSGCVTSNLGTTCASDADCLNGDNHHCQLVDATAASGYCTTTGCASNDGCNTASHYACLTTANPTYCRAPVTPMNEGKACTAQGPDPVTCGAEAPFCILNSCTSITCSTDLDCSAARKCCDLSAFSPGLHACLGACL